MDKKQNIKFLVKKNFVQWAPTVDEIVLISSKIISHKKNDDTVNALFIELKEMVDFCIELCKTQLERIIDETFFSTTTRLYVRKRFVKEYYMFSKHFTSQIILKANLSTFVPESHKLEAVAKATRIKNIVKKLKRLKIIINK